VLASREKATEVMPLLASPTASRLRPVSTSHNWVLPANVARATVLLSGAKATPCTGPPSSFLIVRSKLPVRSHNITVQSFWPLARSSPSPEKASDSIQSPVLSEFCDVQDCASHKWRVFPSPPLANSFPSGEKAIALIEPGCESCRASLK